MISDLDKRVPNTEEYLVKCRDELEDSNVKVMGVRLGTRVEDVRAETEDSSPTTSAAPEHRSPATAVVPDLDSMSVSTSRTFLSSPGPERLRFPCPYCNKPAEKRS